MLRNTLLLVWIATMTVVLVSCHQFRETAKKVVRRVIRKRLDYVTGLFREAGFSPAEARARGELMAVYIMMSEEADLIDRSLEERLRLFKRQARSLMG